MEAAAQLGAELPALEALRQWMRATVEFVATKKGMVAALDVASSSSSDLTVRSGERLIRSLDPLLRRAWDEGAIREGINPEDILRTVVEALLHPRPAGLARQRVAPPGCVVPGRDAIGGPAPMLSCVSICQADTHAWNRLITADRCAASQS